MVCSRYDTKIQYPRFAHWKLSIECIARQSPPSSARQCVNSLVEIDLIKETVRNCTIPETLTFYQASRPEAQISRHFTIPSLAKTQ